MDVWAIDREAGEVSQGITIGEGWALRAHSDRFVSSIRGKDVGNLNQQLSSAGTVNSRQDAIDRIDFKIIFTNLHFLFAQSARSMVESFPTGSPITEYGPLDLRK